MKRLSSLLNHNPLNINIEREFFIRLFCLLVLLIHFKQFFDFATMGVKNFPYPVMILAPLIKPLPIAVAAVIFFISIGTVIWRKSSPRFLRWIVFLSFFVLIAAQGSFGLVNHDHDSMILILLFLALLPQEALKGEDKSTFNRGILYATRLTMLFYTISAFHKFNYFFECSFSQGCLGQVSFLEYHIFNNALIRQFSLPFATIIEPVSPMWMNFFYFLLCVLEFFAFFATYSHKALKIVLIGLIGMHMGSFIFMKIPFLPFIITHGLLLIFFLRKKEYEHV